MILYKGTVDGAVDERWVGKVLFGSSYLQIQPFLMPEPCDLWIDAWFDGHMERGGS